MKDKLVRYGKKSSDMVNSCSISEAVKLPSLRLENL